MLLYLPDNKIETQEDWLKMLDEIKREVGIIEDERQAVEVVTGSIIDSLRRSIPDAPFGLLFSGGVDSILLAYLAKKNNLDFKCYLSVLDYEGFGVPHDLERAQSAAEILGLDLKIVKTSLDELEEILPKVIRVLGTCDPVPVIVMATLYPVMEAVKKDGLKYFMSGMGVEQTHAGGDRYRGVEDINKLCWERLAHFDNGVWRDVVIGKSLGLTMIAPFFDREFIKAGMSVAGKLKEKDDHQKYIFRLAARKLGLLEELAMRRPRPAQYASKFDRGLDKLVKRAGFKYRREYLESL